MVFDILVFLFILCGVFFGFKEGFVNKAFNLTSWALSFYFPFRFHDQLRPHIEHVVNDDKFSFALSLAAIFIVSFIFLRIIKKILLSVVKTDMFKVPDQILGSILGLVEGISVSIFAYMMIGVFLPQNIQPERSKHLLKKASLISLSFLPPNQSAAILGYLSKRHADFRTDNDLESIDLKADYLSSEKEI